MPVFLGAYGRVQLLHENSTEDRNLSRVCVSLSRTRQFHWLRHCSLLDRVYYILQLVSPIAAVIYAVFFSLFVYAAFIRPGID